MQRGVSITHRTAYRYDAPVRLDPQTIRLHPSAHARMPVRAFRLAVEPAGGSLHRCADPWGNMLSRAVFPERVARFEVSVSLEVDLAPLNPFDFLLDPAASRWPFEYDPASADGLAPYRACAPPGPLLAALARGIGTGPEPVIDLLVRVNRLVSARVGYRSRAEAGVRSPESTLALGEGSCRDSAWLLVQLLRRLGLAARFMSGYLVQLRPDEPAPDGEFRPAADGVELHAWAEAFLPGAGWIGLDATSGLLAAEGHVALAGAPIPAQAAPISGGVERAAVGFDVAMAVRRLDPD